MEELLTLIAKLLVNNPEEVSVTKVEKETVTVLQLKVAPSDMGRVIGKKGKIAQSIRTVIKSATYKESKKVVVDIIEWVII